MTGSISQAIRTFGLTLVVTVALPWPMAVGAENALERNEESIIHKQVGPYEFAIPKGFIFFPKHRFDGQTKLLTLSAILPDLRMKFAEDVFAKEVFLDTDRITIDISAIIEKNFISMLSKNRNGLFVNFKKENLKNGINRIDGPKNTSPLPNASYYLLVKSDEIFSFIKCDNEIRHRGVKTPRFICVVDFNYLDYLGTTIHVENTHLVNIKEIIEKVKSLLSGFLVKH